MVTKYFIKKGFVYKDSKSSDNGFDLMRWLKKMLTKLNVPFFDECCDSEKVLLPIRYNVTDNVLETIDPDTGEWVELPIGFGGIPVEVDPG